MDYTRFQWREAKPGVWNRAIDEGEYAYVAFAKQHQATGRSFFHMTGHLSLVVQSLGFESQDLAVKNLDEALRKAWRALRYCHPAIAAQTKWDAASAAWVKEYDANSYEEWFKKSFVRVAEEQTGQEFTNSDPPAPNLPTLFVLTPPSAEGSSIRRDLIFRSPHDIIDGIGTLHLLNNLAKITSRFFVEGDAFEMPPSQLDPTRLSPPFRVAAAIPPKPSNIVQQRIAEATASTDEDSAEPVGIPYKKGAQLPGKHQRIELILSQDETKDIMAAGKRLMATPTHLFHAAIAIALRDIQKLNASDKPRKIQYVNYILRNERGICVPPFNDGALHPAGIYHSVSNQKLVVYMTTGGNSRDNAETEQKEAFLAAVNMMKQFYLAVRDDKEQYALVPHIWARGTPELPTPTAENWEEPPSIPIPPVPEIAAVSISSMGRIDNIMPANHGPIELHNPWVTGEELRNGLGTFLGTFRGQMSVSAAYNEAWHDREGVERFLKQLVAIVKNGLDLNDGEQRK